MKREEQIGYGYGNVGNRKRHCPCDVHRVMACVEMGAICMMQDAMVGVLSLAMFLVIAFIFKMVTKQTEQVTI